jgi:hypothetical protein
MGRPWIDIETRLLGAYRLLKVSVAAGEGRS